MTSTNVNTVWKHLHTKKVQKVSSEVTMKSEQDR